MIDASRTALIKSGTQTRVCQQKRKKTKDTRRKLHLGRSNYHLDAQENEAVTPFCAGQVRYSVHAANLILSAVRNTNKKLQTRRTHILAHYC
jgi:hypothetical protein